MLDCTIIVGRVERDILAGSRGTPGRVERDSRLSLLQATITSRPTSQLRGMENVSEYCVWRMGVWLRLLEN